MLRISTSKRNKSRILGLVGMELIFFIVVYLVLCFTFVIKTLLITHQCLTVAVELCLHRKGCLVLTPAPNTGYTLRMGKRLGGDLVGTGDPDYPKVLCHLLSCPVIRLGGGRSAGGELRRLLFQCSLSSDTSQKSICW